MPNARARLDELVGSGLAPSVAAQVAICELSLAAGAVEAVDGVLSAQVAAALCDVVVYQAVRAHCVAPQWAAAWERLARWSGDPARMRCLELARLCRRDRLRVVS